jgi:hypothetical protein
MITGESTELRFAVAADHRAAVLGPFLSSTSEQYASGV